MANLDNVARAKAADKNLSVANLTQSLTVLSDLEHMKGSLCYDLSKRFIEM